MYCRMMCDRINRCNEVDQELYEKYDIKRGLRNSNGTGVRVGLTKIGCVEGYREIDGVKTPWEGNLYYRGINVKDIVNACIEEKRRGYEETSYLLLFGELPDQRQLDLYKQYLGERRELPFSFVRDTILTAPSLNIMNKLARCILTFYSYDENPDELTPENILRQSIDLIARMPTLTRYGYQAKVSYDKNASLHFHQPLPELSTAENVLRMIRASGEYTELEAMLLDLCLILHAEHGGGNNSAFTTHVISSSGTDTYAAISAAVGSLKGPKHGGANAKVVQMIRELKESVSDAGDRKAVDDYVIRILRGQAGDRSGLLYGFGHAVYTKSDPRAVILKKMAEKLAEQKGLQEEFELYNYIEENASELFFKARGIEREMMANVDLYSGFVYSALDIPTEISTPLFAVARISGWCAHRMEELFMASKIMRPAYIDASERIPYTPIDER
ncbi:MAG: citrate synthase [Firmicutes bacterium]|nr:citrate synthase [Bacillota bacterium]